MSRVSDADRTPLPLDAAGLVRYLSDHQITIVVRDGKPALRRPPQMSGEWFEAHVCRVRPSLAKHRDEILTDLQLYADAPATPLPRPLTSAEVRAAVFARLSQWVERYREWGAAVVGGYCEYDRSTAFLQAGATEFPRHWTRAAALDFSVTARTPLTVWEVLPGARPPAGWKAPKDWLPTEVMQPPPGWQAPAVNRQRLARKAWAARWKTEATFKADLPD